MPTNFSSYLDWYTARHLRKRGAPPATSTMRTKRLYLSSISRATGYSDEVLLGTSLGDRVLVEHLLDVLSARFSPGALRQAFYVLKSFGEYARCKGIITSVALVPDDLPGAGPAKPIIVYSPAEMEEFVNAARYHSLRWWAFITFLADSGRRVGEALNLRWEWLQVDGAQPYFELPTSKNGDPQYIPLTRRLAGSVLTEENIGKLKVDTNNFLRSPQEFVFPWRYSTVYGMFDRFCEKTGLPNRGFHNFRHTVITERIARGVPIQAVATLAGHRSPAITMARYSHATALDYARYLDGGGAGGTTVGNGGGEVGG